MKIGRKVLWVVLAVVGYGGVATAELSVVKNGDVSYVSGGAGDEEQDKLRAMSDQFNLKVTMALSNGDYVGGVNVAIQDAQGKTVLSAVADGPILLAALKPGAYTVAATLNGKKLEKPALVGAGKQQELTFSWASE